MNTGTTNTLDLKRIAFGMTDAFNEVSKLGPDYIVDAFVENEKYRKDEFLSGQKFYICGKKGTGKTAFLRFLECQLSNDSSNLVIPIRFKTDLDETDKDQLIKLSTSKSETLEETSSEENFSTANILTQKSYTLMWKTFLINQIISHSKKGEYSIFKETDEYNLLNSLLAVLYESGSAQGMVMPKLKKGTIDVSGSIASLLNTRVKIEIDFDARTKKADYIKLAKTLVNLFNSLEFDTNRVYILVDELELSVRSKSAYQKDIALVRDLILAIENLNKVCSSKGYDIHIMASVRSEVVNSVLSAGFEINKCIEDYGVTVDWFQKGGDYRDNPLLKIIENKIRASERMAGLEPTADIWKTYFEETIHGLETRKYILNSTWYRPRDVVRLMNLLQYQSNQENIFTQKVFDAAQQEYSTRMWNEVSEELILSYTADDLKAVKTFFTSIELPFSYDDLVLRANKLGEIYPNVKAFFDKISMADFIEKMFSLGVVGNTGKRMVFCFLGDQDVSLIDPLVIHTPLRNFFAVHGRKG